MVRGKVLIYLYTAGKLMSTGHLRHLYAVLNKLSCVFVRHANVGRFMKPVRFQLSFHLFNRSFTAVTL